MPAFGFAREHQERLQSLAAAQLECQEAGNAFNTLLLKASESAFQVFERMLAEHGAPGLQISSPRKLFGLWIDAAEQAYAEVALSKDYRELYGNLVNAQMKLRAGVQKEVELASASLGMPTRSELDGAHRKIVELERALRKLRDAGLHHHCRAAGRASQAGTARRPGPLAAPGGQRNPPGPAGRDAIDGSARCTEAGLGRRARRQRRSRASSRRVRHRGSGRRPAGSRARSPWRRCRCRHGRRVSGRIRVGMNGP